MKIFNAGYLVSSGCVLVSSLLVACGGGGSDVQVAEATEPPPVTNPPPPSNPPTISGTPDLIVTQGLAYSFVPTASGNNLTFSIDNRPDWADFNTTSGMLSGTPGGNDVRPYTGIVITVSDGSESASLSAFDIAVVGTATGAATLSWTIPTQNEDGTPIGNDLAGFRIYYSMTSGNYSEFVPVNSIISTGMVENLSPATWFFVVTAVDLSGNESAFSNEASATI